MNKFLNNLTKIKEELKSTHDDSDRFWLENCIDDIERDLKEKLFIEDLTDLIYMHNFNEEKAPFKKRILELLKNDYPEFLI